MKSFVIFSLIFSIYSLHICMYTYVYIHTYIYIGARCREEGIERKGGRKREGNEEEDARYGRGKHLRNIHSHHCFIRYVDI